MTSPEPVAARTSPKRPVPRTSPEPVLRSRVLPSGRSISTSTESRLPNEKTDPRSFGASTTTASPRDSTVKRSASSAPPLPLGTSRTRSSVPSVTRRVMSPCCTSTLRLIGPVVSKLVSSGVVIGVSLRSMSVVVSWVCWVEWAAELGPSADPALHALVGGAVAPGGAGALRADVDRHAGGRRGSDRADDPGVERLAPLAASSSAATLERLGEAQRDAGRVAGVLR